MPQCFTLYYILYCMLHILVPASLMGFRVLDFEVRSDLHAEEACHFNYILGTLT